MKRPPKGPSGQAQRLKQELEAQMLNRQIQQQEEEEKRLKAEKAREEKDRRDRMLLLKEMELEYEKQGLALPEALVKENERLAFSGGGQVSINPDQEEALRKKIQVPHGEGIIKEIKTSFESQIHQLKMRKAALEKELEEEKRIDHEQRLAQAKRKTKLPPLNLQSQPSQSASQKIISRRPSILTGTSYKSIEDVPIAELKRMQSQTNLTNRDGSILQEHPPTQRSVKSIKVGPLHTANDSF
jgi:hypothetical protein